MFRALVLYQDADGSVSAAIEELDDDSLPEGDVTVDVEYSTVNYKDSLAICNGAPVVRTWPMVPGIDFAGAVRESTHPDFETGQLVVLNGWGVGEQHWGGLAQRARVSGDWLVALPASITTAQAMAIGTAGYTAMLCVMALERHGVAPGDGTVLVTGAAGGVGSVAIALLAAAGYEVAASTGRPSESDYLRGLGAAEIVDRGELSEPGRPMQKARFAGAVDTVGSHTLANVCAQIRPFGCVAACGNAQGMDFTSSVAPFILRGVTLAGIDSVNQPKANRIEAWDRLAADLDRDKLAAMTETVGLDDVPSVASRMLEGGVRGRVVVDPGRAA